MDYYNGLLILFRAQCDVFGWPKVKKIFRLVSFMSKKNIKGGNSVKCGNKMFWKKNTISPVRDSDRVKYSERKSFLDSGGSCYLWSACSSVTLSGHSLFRYWFANFWRAWKRGEEQGWPFTFDTNTHFLRLIFTCSEDCVRPSDLVL